MNRVGGTYQAGFAQPAGRLAGAAASNAARRRAPHAYPMGETAGLGGLGFGGGLIVAYLAITRVGHLSAAKIGIMIGPVPLFLTEMFLIALVLVVAITRTSSLVCWLVTGGMARLPGVMLWLLFLTSIVYAIAAFDQWGILAIRDLAIFSYGLVYALVYFVLDTRAKAAAAMGIISFSLMALLAYAATYTEWRFLNLGFAVLCFFGLALTQTRSAVLGMGLSMLYSFIGMRTTQRISFAALIVGGGLLLVATPVLMPESGLAHAISSFGQAVEGGMSLAKDDNFYFRLLRWDAVYELWRESPIFGIGFGQPLVPRSMFADVEDTGFNVGLPHNTYLTVLARLGLFGFVLIIGAWFVSIGMATVSIRRQRFGGDAFAAGSALVAMIGFATFTLFFERPMHAATVWILAAIASRLAGPDDAEATAGTAARTGWPTASPRRGIGAPIGETVIQRARRIALAKGFR